LESWRKTLDEFIIEVREKEGKNVTIPTARPYSTKGGIQLLYGAKKRGRIYRRFTRAFVERGIKRVQNEGDVMFSMQTRDERDFQGGTVTADLEEGNSGIVPKLL